MGTPVCVPLALRRAVGGNGMTRLGSLPLLMATDLVVLLLSKGADASLEDMSGKTPLILSASQGHTAIVQALLAHLGALGKSILSPSPLHMLLALTQRHRHEENG